MALLNRSTVVILATMTTVMVAFGIMVPVFPVYVEAMGASGRDLGLLMAMFALMQLLSSPIWGNVSDRVGRKPVVLVGLAGCTLMLLFYGLATRLWMLYLVRAMGGAVASATFPTALAYIGDVTSKEDRGSGMGLIAAAQYSGIILGPALGGWLSGFSLTFPFYFAAGLCALLLIFATLLLPESLPVGRRVRVAGGGWFCGPNLPAMWRALRGPLACPLILTFVASFGMYSFWGIFGMYALLRYGYGPGPVGLIMTSIGIGSTIVQAGLTGPLIRLWGEKRLIRITLIASAAGFVLMLPAGSFITVLLSTCFFVMVNSLLRPVVTAQISKLADQDGQGAAMGLTNSFVSLGQIVGPLWSGFALDLNLWLPYLSGALAMVAGLAAELVDPVNCKRRCLANR